jgi:PEP-CTERM motif
MNTKVKELVAITVLLFAGSAMADPITISPGVNPDGTPCTATTCWEISPGTFGNGAPEPSAKEFAALVGLAIEDYELFYKSDQSNTVGSAEDPDATFAGNYTTVYDNEPNDPSEATITWDGPLDTFINCGRCFLWVKDGRQDPYVYVFDISWWNGMDTLFLDNFWPYEGAISNVGIFGARGGDVQVPEPGTLGLLGIAALGLGLVRRRKV